MTVPEAAGMRLAIYARVSTDEQREGQTIDSQIAELERFAREKAWVVTGIYKDEGWSGGIMARPDLDRLRDDAASGRFQAVLINDVDRLARDVAHLGIIKRDLERQSIRVIFRKLPSEVSPTYNLMVNVLGSFAEFERELIADRTRRGRRHKVEVRKQYLGSNTAYGYRYIPIDRMAGKEGRLEIDPGRAPIVRKMFEWVDTEGLSARRVIVRLNQMRVSPGKGGQWGKSSVLRILHNEMYAGVWHYNKFQGCEPVHRRSEKQYRRHVKSSVRQRPHEEWLPVSLPDSLILVSRDRWERVQNRLRRNIAFSPRREKHFYLLKGLVHCGACGARYVGDPCHGRFYYRCVKRCRRMPSITESLLDDAVVAAVERVIQNPALILSQIEQLDRSEAAEIGDRQKDAAEAAKELEKLQTEEARLLEAYRSEIITAGQLGSELEKLRVRRTAAEARQANSATTPQKPPTADIKKSAEEYCEEARQDLHSFTPEELREFLRTIIRNIVFEGQQVRIQGHFPVGALPETDGVHDPLQHPAAMSVGGCHGINQTKEICKGHHQGNRQEANAFGRRHSHGSRRGTRIDSDIGTIQTAEAVEIAATGISWQMKTRCHSPSNHANIEGPASSS